VGIAGPVATFDPGTGTEVGLGLGISFGMKRRNSDSNFLASSTVEKSTAIKTIGSLGFVGQLATNIRELARASACELIHLSKV
jgi:hypothetical protein